MLAHVNLATLLCFATALSGVHGDTHALHARRGHPPNGPPPNGSPINESPSGNEPSPNLNPPKGSPSSPPKSAPNPAPESAPIDPPGDPCKRPAEGWSEKYQPDPKCGNSPLLDWCKEVEDRNTIYACWDNGDYWCVKCAHSGKKSAQKQHAPGKTVKPAKFPSCTSESEKQTFCSICTTFSGCTTVPSGRL